MPYPHQETPYLSHGTREIHATGYAGSISPFAGWAVYVGGEKSAFHLYHHIL
jgi:hypothetical protein